jgi:hypothetical protein
MTTTKKELKGRMSKPLLNRWIGQWKFAIGKSFATKPGVLISLLERDLLSTTIRGRKEEGGKSVRQSLSFIKRRYEIGKVSESGLKLKGCCSNPWHTKPSFPNRPTGSVDNCPFSLVKHLR